MGLESVAETTAEKKSNARDMQRKEVFIRFEYLISKFHEKCSKMIDMNVNYVIKLLQQLEVITRCKNGRVQKDDILTFPKEP